MSKRTRTDAGYTSKQRIAAAINARTNAMYPYSKYGRTYTMRGIANSPSMLLYGDSYKAATSDQRAARKAAGFVGRGLYQGRGGYIADIAKWAGRGIGGLLGNKDRGGMIGGALGGLAEKLSGRGLYQGRGSYANINETMQGSEQSSPSMRSVSDESGSVIITNREYVGDIFAPATSGIFDLQSFPLNPGLEQTFPWLSQMAANYEEYEFIQLVFEFKSAIQDVNSTNGQVGTVIAATNYNAAQPKFTDKPQMVSYYGSISSKTTDGFISGVECDPAKLSGTVGSYVRTNPVLTGEDVKTYDHGSFQLATHNIPTAMLNGTLGELFCSYTIKLRKPKFLTGRGLAITRALFVASVDRNGQYPMGFAADILRGQQNNLAVRIIPNTNYFDLYFPAYYAGNLEIRYSAEGNVLSSATTSSAVFGNVVKVLDVYAGQIPSGGDSPGSELIAYNSTSHIYIVHVKVSPVTNAADNYLRIYTNLGAQGGSISQSAVDVYEYNFSLNGPSGAPVLINTAGVIVTPV